MTARDLLFILVGTTAIASANGRAPAANGVTFQPGDANALYVRSTFGLLVSHDGGCHFYWLCEENIGYGGAFDPAYAVAGDGTIFAGTFSGLRVSRDGGCSFQAAPDLASRYISGVELGADGAVWASTGDSGVANDVFASSDGGATFQRSGLASTTVFYTGVHVAPSDPARVYVTGQTFGTTPTTMMMRTVDHGGIWTSVSLANMALGSRPQVVVAAIDPSDPDRVFAISVGANPPFGDRLYRSVDGGAAFVDVLATTQPITGVAIRGAGAVYAATQLAGSFASADDGATFTAVASPPQLACLGVQGGALIGCGTDGAPDDFAIGRSVDGVHWEKLFQLRDLAGPLAGCPAGTREEDVCDAQLWRSLQIQLGAHAPKVCGAAPDGPPAEPDGPPATTSSGGCCDASDQRSALLAVWLWLGAATMRRCRERGRMAR